MTRNLICVITRAIQQRYWPHRFTFIHLRLRGVGRVGAHLQENMGCSRVDINIKCLAIFVSHGGITEDA